MSHRRTKQLSNFFGPHHRYYNPTFPGVATIQFFDIEQGDLWNPSDGAQLDFPFTAPARPGLPSWFFQNAQFTIAFRQDLPRTRLLGVHNPTGTPFFILDITPGVYTPCINSILDGSGIFAFGGTAIIAWKDLPSP